MKQSQINQAFVYIAMILVIGAIALVGARAIISVLSANCESKTVEFNSKFLSLIEQYSDRGTVATESIPAPCDASKVCFVSASSMNGLFLDADPIIQDSVRDGSYNIFFKGKFTMPVGKSDKLESFGNALVCVNVSNNYVNLKFSGTGRTTVVERG